VWKSIICPTIDGLNKEGRPFKGVIYFGLMLTKDGAKVVEYNARFGDPEAQAVLPLLKTDLLKIVNAILQIRLKDITIEFSDQSAVVVMLCSGGYPGEIVKGKEIFIGNVHEDVKIYHSGTANAGGKLVTNGGRVIGLTAVAKSIDEARQKVYSNTSKVVFDGVHFRTDIGKNVTK
jgi:phosphoribosylamine--glycine ligase